MMLQSAISIVMVTMIFIGGIVVQVQKRRYERGSYSKEDQDPRMRARSVVVHRCDDPEPLNREV